MRSKTFPSIRWTLPFFLLCSQVLSSVAAPPAVALPTLLQDLGFKTVANRTVVVVRANRVFDYTSYYPNPRLFILDIPGAQSGLQNNSVAIGTSLVDVATITRIGEGQRGLVRIEFSLNQPIQYALHNEGSNLQIHFSPIGEPGQGSDRLGADKSGLPRPGNEEIKDAAKPVAGEERVDLSHKKELPRTQSSIPGEGGKSPSLISDVKIEEDAQQIQFVLQTTGKPSFKHFQLDGPNRLVVDVDSSSFRISRRAVEIHSDLIQRIRFGYGDSQQGKLVRCVFDLTRKAPYSISGTDSGIIVQFAKQGQADPLQLTQSGALSHELAPAGPEEFSQLPLAAASPLSSRSADPGILFDVQPIAVPQLLAAPMTAPVIEGTVSLSEIEISRRGTDVSISDSGLQLAELLPPASPSPEHHELSSLEDAIATQHIHDPGSSEAATSAASFTNADHAFLGQTETHSLTLQPRSETQEFRDSGIRDLLATEAADTSTERLPKGDEGILLALVSTSPLPSLGAVAGPSSLKPVAVGQTVDPSTPAALKSTEADSESGNAPIKRNDALSAPETTASTQPSPSQVNLSPDAHAEQADLKLTEPSPSLEVKPSDTANSVPSSDTATSPHLARRGPAADKTKEPRQELSLAQLAAPPALPPSGAVIAPAAKLGGGQIISQVTTVQAPKYSGETFNLELKDADLKDFFHLIGDFSGLNVVLDPDVKGSLTIFLKDVPWDQALDVVLKNNGLGKQLEGNVLRIATNQTLEAEETQRKRLSDARILAAELQTETRVLNYAKAADLSQVLKKILSPRGDIIVDSRTNSMIISDVPGKFSSIDALIKQLDKKIKQVEIEARVISATRDFLRDIGVQIGALIGNNAENKLSGAVPGNPFSRNPPPSVTIQPGQSGGAPNSLPLISNLAANAATSGLAFFGGFTHNVLVDTIITAAERHGTAKLLSKPKIITQENIEGFVQQGVKIPVQTTINNTISVQFFDFALKLRVTPQITDEGTISMIVNVENSTPDFSRQVQGVPTVNTQETKTTVLVDNGGTVVIGGVLVDNEQTNLRQVPGVGSLPLIGNLFKNRSVTKQTQELIFFISPKIL